jgi:glyoxylase-like metal-dependent hydrolase (beta-lactamase superfamily II)
VPEENVRIAGERVLDLEAFPTPGHASHHVSYLAPDGSCFAGDAAGVRIAPLRYVAPVAPPPDIDVEAWERTIDAIEERRPERLLLAHYGVADDPDFHLAELRSALRTWAERARDGSEEEFVAAAEADVRAVADAATAELFQQAGPLWQSYAGLRRYWDKKGEAAAA